MAACPEGAALSWREWSVTYGGQESALDAELASQNALTKSGDLFWAPKKPVTKTAAERATEISGSGLLGPRERSAA